MTLKSCHISTPKGWKLSNSKISDKIQRLTEQPNDNYVQTQTSITYSNTKAFSQQKRDPQIMLSFAAFTQNFKSFRIHLWQHLEITGLRYIRKCLLVLYMRSILFVQVVVLVLSELLHVERISAIPFLFRRQLVVFDCVVLRGNVKYLLFHTIS